MLAEFSVPIPANADGVLALKRLASIADAPDSTLVLQEEGDAWRCLGLATIVAPASSVEIGRPELSRHRQAPGGVSIRIDGPGALRVTDVLATFILHGGRIRQSVEMFYAPPIKELLYRIDLALTQNTDIPRYLGSDGRTHQSWLAIEFALSRIVAKMRDARKGGALVFPGDLDTEHIEWGRYRTSGVALGGALHSFYAACRKSAAATLPEELRVALAQWQNAHQTILRTADCIASVSQVDGCVVMRPTLEVVAFGAKIKAFEPSSGEDTVLTLVDSVTKQHESEHEILRLGTRHRSAYELCRRLPGTSAIVISQDGDIRVFASDSKNVYFVEALEASSAGLPHF